MLEAILFGIATVGNLYVSRASLRVPASHGFYRYIRHPLYSSLLFLGWGIFFKRPSWLGSLLVAGVTLFLILTARVEESENVRFFGEDYRDYCKRTQMFVPYLF